MSKEESEERDHPSELGNYPRRPDDPRRSTELDRERDGRQQRWDEDGGARSFLGDPPPDRFRDPFTEDWQRPMRIPEPIGQGVRENGGEFAGRGPKNYQRSDERIHEDACDRLTEDSHIDASDIQVSVKDGEITLEGTIADGGMKRFAEDCLGSVCGARQVHNRLRVERPAPKG